MNDLELESAFQGSRFQGQRRLLSLWNRREFPEIVASEETFGKAITVVDCWLYDSEPVSNVRHDIQEREIEEWLDIVRPRSKSDQVPSAGLRVIHRGQWDSKRSPFSQHVTQAINRSFGLPDSVSNYASSLSGACARLRFEDSQGIAHVYFSYLQIANFYYGLVFVCRRGKSAWTTTTVLRYDPKTNITVGCVYSARPLEIRDDLERIPSRFAEFPHPLLLPLLMHELALEHLTRNMDDLDMTLQVIEAQTGFSDYEKISNSRKRDYRPQIDSLGSVTHRFAYDQVRLRSVELTNQFLRQQISFMGTWLTDDQRRAELEVITIRLQERLDLSWSSIQHLQLYRGFEKRLQVRQNVVRKISATQLEVQVSSNLQWEVIQPHCAAG
jgi:hypothetical protein